MRVRVLDARVERETKLQGALPDALDDSGQTQRLLRAMAVIDDQEGAITAAMRLYVRTEHGAESLCVARNYTEVSPRFEVARATVLEAVRHLGPAPPSLRRRRHFARAFAVRARAGGARGQG